MELKREVSKKAAFSRTDKVIKILYLYINLLKQLIIYILILIANTR